jgi:hypothetical protein
MPEVVVGLGDEEQGSTLERQRRVVELVEHRNEEEGRRSMLSRGKNLPIGQCPQRNGARHTGFRVQRSAKRDIRPECGSRRTHAI